MLQVHGNGIEDRLTDIGQRQDDEDDTFDEDRCQSSLPGIAHLNNDCVGKIGIQTHTGCKNEGVVCKSCHQKCGYAGSQCSCCENSTAVHA